MTVFENMMKRYGSLKLVIANALLENNIICNYENTGYTAYSGIDGYKYIDPVRRVESVLPLTIDEVIRISKVFTEPCTMVCKDNDDARNRCLQTYIDHLNSKDSSSLPVTKFVNYLNNKVSDETGDDESGDINENVPDVIEMTVKEFGEKYNSIMDAGGLYEPLEVINSQGRRVVLAGYLLDYTFLTSDSAIYDDVVRNDLFDTYDVEHIVHIKHTPRITRGDSIKVN